ncbi:CHASE2 domain-containing protein [Leadbettera azotonutricia]|uniref:Adenylate/guanylate cyclase n=1 Tax=Leadbettera azotonutricia (strain ATCC BAA-888 / DSM 13862 / ZAS-9) TaxID=545695 RepID=F5Y8T2_LEAAZ|nr:adenylate/guanylate cyclase domain-containing protein [Leadbettera azotonutricia]AEF80865.1 adenylate/guanylate cyclase [Leadbettera azotonutricia ZAS-9]
MKQFLAKFHKPLAALVIAVFLCFVAVFGYLHGAFDYVEYKLYDFRVKLFANSSRRSNDIIVVFLDQDSLNWADQNKHWGWPWPRAAYAEIVDYMRLGGAKSIAFDVIFSEPSIYGAADDAAFARASSAYGRVAQGVLFNLQTGITRSWPSGLDKPVFDPRSFGASLGNYSLSEEEGATAGQFPIPELRNSAGVIGSINGKADSDGIFRRMRLFTLFDGRAIPGLSAASLLVTGESKEIIDNPEAKTIEWGNYTIPVDKEGKTLLRFKGDLERYPNYSAMHILQSAEAVARGEEPLLPPENFKDAYVFFGYYAPGLYDIFASPISSLYPGVGAHITMLDNLLTGDFIKQSPQWLDMLLTILPSVLIILLVLFSSRIRLTVSGTVLIFALLFTGSVAVYRFGIWVPMAAPLITAIFAFIVATLYGYATEGSQKRYIKGAFSRYLSPKVIEELIDDPSKLDLGGEKREMTAIFTDIQRFSSISEGLQKEYGEDGPRALVNLLNLYLTEMSNIILENEGTVDKYEGDAIIAFFGAPIWTERHAALACRSAIQMKKKELELKAQIMDPEGAFYSPLGKLIEKGIIRSERPLYTRIGINTGDMVVGNMGTPDKMDYTIMGDAVNLAARLEGVNKQYDTGGILISDFTRNQIGDEFILRGLSRVRVVGKKDPVRLFELLELREEASQALLDMAGLWDKGFKAYESKEFLEAKNVFSTIWQRDNNDTVAKLYLGRCEKFQASPPEPDKWDDGVDNLTEK